MDILQIKKYKNSSSVIKIQIQLLQLFDNFCKKIDAHVIHSNSYLLYTLTLSAEENFMTAPLREGFYPYLTQQTEPQFLRRPAPNGLKGVNILLAATHDRELLINQSAFSSIKHLITLCGHI